MQCMEEKDQIVHRDTDTYTRNRSGNIINNVAGWKPFPSPQVENINSGNSYFHRNILQHSVSQRPESGITGLFRNEGQRGTKKVEGHRMSVEFVTFQSGVDFGFVCSFFLGVPRNEVVQQFEKIIYDLIVIKFLFITK
jgi:hypothetical protein